MIRAEVDYYRHVGGGLREYVRTEAVEAKSRTEFVRKVRAIKKDIASQRKYNIVADTITYRINYL